jgi:hypothetical protein
MSVDIPDKPAEETEAPLVAREPTLAEDLTEPASDLSPAVMSTRANALLEAFGLSDLSFFPLPGIFERMDPRNDRLDSFVSDLEKEG